MAIYHFTARMVRRKEKRVVTQVAAYKFADRIKCARTGEVYDYRKNERVTWTGINGPAFAPAWVQYRSVLWNAVELAETRKDAQLAREYEMALPSEIGLFGHILMMERFTDYLVERFGLVAEWAIQAPRREGDQRNVFGVVLVPTRRIDQNGFTAKIREMSVLPRSVEILTDLRKLWATITNDILEMAGSDERVDHRSLTNQKAAAEASGNAELAAALDREPQKKLDRVQFQAARRRRQR